MISKNENPEHIAIIMDGNGRWAKTKNKDRSYGHRAGSENVINIVEACVELNIKYLTLYAFSTENWKRPESEKKALFKLLNEFYKKEIKRLISNNILVKHIGDISAFPLDTQKIIENTEEETSKKCDNPVLTVILALNYGSREEIKTAFKRMHKDASEGLLNIDSIENETISEYLYTKDIPDPDLIIRTSGEYRLSNFLMYQASYSELYFTDILWPDFSKDHFKKAINEYNIRERRYGGI